MKSDEMIALGCASCGDFRFLGQVILQRTAFYMANWENANRVWLG